MWRGSTPSTFPIYYAGRHKQFFKQMIKTKGSKDLKGSHISCAEYIYVSAYHVLQFTYSQVKHNIPYLKNKSLDLKKLK